MPSPLLAESIALEIGGQEPWPADVKLYQPYEVEQILLPDNANCLAVQAYLRMCGLTYQIESRANAEFMSPSGTVPFIKCGKYVIPELEPIVSFVENKGISLTTNFDDSQKNDMKAYISLINFVLGNSELYVCWVDEDTFNAVTKPRYSSVYPWPLNHIQTRSKRAAVIKHLKAVKYYNKTIEEVYQEVEQCCRSLSDRLDDKEYFFGSNPTEVDALLFGHLYSLTNKCKINKLVTIVEKFPTLQVYCKNVWMKYFSSFYDFNLLVCDSFEEGENTSKVENGNSIIEGQTIEKLFNEIGLSGSKSVYGIANLENNTLRLSMVIDLEKSTDSNNSDFTQFSATSKDDQSQEIESYLSEEESVITESDITSNNTIKSNNDKSIELNTQSSKSTSFIKGSMEKLNEFAKCTSLPHINSRLKSQSSLSKLNLKSKQILPDTSKDSNNRARLMKYLNKYLGAKNHIELSSENKLNIKEDKIAFRENNSLFNHLFDSTFKISSKSHDNFQNVHYLFRGNISLQKPPQNSKDENIKGSLASIKSSLTKMSQMSEVGYLEDRSSRSTMGITSTKSILKQDSFNELLKMISVKFYNKEEKFNKILVNPLNPPCHVGTQTSFYSLFFQKFKSINNVESWSYDKLIDFDFLNQLPDELQSQYSQESETN